MLNKLLVSIGGRKFFLVLLVYVSTIALLMQGFIKQVEFIELTQLLLISFPLGLVLQKSLSTVNDKEYELDVNGGRKFQLACLVYITVFALLQTQYIDSAVYYQITTWAVSSYIAGNVLSKVDVTEIVKLISKKSVEPENVYGTAALDPKDRTGSSQLL